MPHFALGTYSKKRTRCTRITRGEKGIVYNVYAFPGDRGRTASLAPFPCQVCLPVPRAASRSNGLSPAAHFATGHTSCYLVLLPLSMNRFVRMPSPALDASVRGTTTELMLIVRSAGGFGCRWRNRPPHPDESVRDGSEKRREALQVIAGFSLLCRASWLVCLGLMMTVCAGLFHPVWTPRATPATCGYPSRHDLILKEELKAPRSCFPHRVPSMRPFARHLKKKSIKALPSIRTASTRTLAARSGAR